MLALAAAAIIVSGAATVTDGDTLRVGDERVRLFAIDAPELAQRCGAAPCGEMARDWVRSFIAGRPVRCEGVERDQYDRLVARCTVNGEDLNRAVVRAGMATAYIEFGRDYADDERQARSGRMGLWAYGLTSPEEFRRAESAARAPANPAPQATGAGCTIKGNVSASGERIYHVPGSRDYAATVITPSKGERWFCSVGEAQSAGWRAPRG